MSNYTIGADPEFVMIESASGKVVSAIPVLKKSKEDKIDLGNGIPVYYDNTLAETNIPPRDSREGFVESVREVMRRIHKRLGDTHELRALPSATYTRKECKHPDAELAGCNPEFCAYEAAMVEPPQFVDTFRSAGGHIHIGRKDFAKFDEFDCEGVFLIDHVSKMAVIRAFDAILGLAFTMIDNTPESIARKKLYGKAGRFRPTVYGVEYRTPSNFWLGSPVLVALAYDLALATVEGMEKGAIKLNEELEAKVREAIDENSVAKAQSLCEEILKPYRSDLWERVQEACKFVPRPIREEWGI